MPDKVLSLAANGLAALLAAVTAAAALDELARRSDPRHARDGARRVAYRELPVAAHPWRFAGGGAEGGSVVDEASLAEWLRALGKRRPAHRIDTRSATDRRFMSFALSEGYATVTTPSSDLPAADAPYVLGVRLTPRGERLLAKHP